MARLIPLVLTALLVYLAAAYSSVGQRNMLRRQKARQLSSAIDRKSTTRRMVSLRAASDGQDIDCGDKNSILHVTSFSMSPSYVPIPGNITISANVRVDTDLSAPISADVTMKKRYFWVWATVPCVEKVGSCTYDDLCSMLPNANDPPTDPCPSEFADLNMPCKCPIASKSYTVQNIQVQIPDPDTDFPLSGLYRVEAVFKSQGAQIGCVRLEMDVQLVN